MGKLKEKRGNIRPRDNNEKVEMEERQDQTKGDHPRQFGTLEEHLYHK